MINRWGKVFSMRNESMQIYARFDATRSTATAETLRGKVVKVDDGSTRDGVFISAKCDETTTWCNIFTRSSRSRNKPPPPTNHERTGRIMRQLETLVCLQNVYYTVHSVSECVCVCVCATCARGMKHCFGADIISGFVVAVNKSSVHDRLFDVQKRHVIF